MRLIDADALQIALIRKYDEVADLLEIVDNQPTAFDVNKVVEELGEATWRYDPPFNDEPYRMVILSNKAVQIVKRGGADDNTRRRREENDRDAKHNDAARLKS